MDGRLETPSGLPPLVEFKSSLKISFKRLQLVITTSNDKIEVGEPPDWQRPASENSLPRQR